MPRTSLSPAARRLTAWAAALSLAVAGAAAGCNQKSLVERAKADAGEDPGGLPPELAAKVVARVGERTITLGDYASALERMNEFDRLRYQSPERRRDLLNEMIDFELLATEARRRGLDKAPETEEAVRQVLRDTMLAESRRDLPSPAEIPAAEVRGYYDAHRDDFREPERRRVSAISLKDAKEAEKILPDARKASPMEWGKLVQKYADGPPLKPSPSHPLEAFGDLGIVGPPGDAKGDHPRVPAALRAAVFEISGDVGTVLDHVVASGDRHFIVKLAGRSHAHERSFQEAERSIRGILLQKKMEDRERELAEALRKQFPVSIDEGALAQVHVQLPGGPRLEASHAAPPPSAPAPAGSARHP
jgi:peptidyl-prolyl cis-trans isomerase C